MKVSDHMSKEIFCANLRDGLRQTFYRMRERGVRHMPVLDDQGNLAGMVSDRDLRRPDWVDGEENVAHYYLLDNATKVETVMTKPAVAVSPDDTLEKAATLLSEHRYGALPVATEDKVVGILSVHDALRGYLKARE